MLSDSNQRDVLALNNCILGAFHIISKINKSIFIHLAKILMTVMTVLPPSRCLEKVYGTSRLDFCDMDYQSEIKVF